MTKKMYYATVEGHLFGRYRKIGDAIGELSSAEAKHPAMAGQITDKNPATSAQKPVAKKSSEAKVEKADS